MGQRRQESVFCPILLLSLVAWSYMQRPELSAALCFHCFLWYRVSQSWHYWHFGQDNTSLYGSLFNGIPGLYPLDVNNISKSWLPKMFPDIAKCPPMGKIPSHLPLWPLFYWDQLTVTLFWFSNRFLHCPLSPRDIYTSLLITLQCLSISETQS